MAGAGLAADASGNIYFLDGTGRLTARKVQRKRTATTVMRSSSFRPLVECWVLRITLRRTTPCELKSGPGSRFGRRTGAARREG